MAHRLISDQDIEAMIDKELSAEDEQHVLNHLKINADARKKYNYMLRQKLKLQNLWKYKA